MSETPVLDHEWQYNPRKAVTDIDRYTARAAELSEKARRKLKGQFDIRYGEGQLASLDVFPSSRAEAPIHVFLHGGYWRGRDKSDYSYIAGALVPQGITTIIMNYDLCPSVTLPEIVTQVRQGLRWVHAHARELGGSADRLTASGHSAGAHLIAMALAADIGEERLPERLLKHAVLISGIYDLEPVLDITVNQEIRLTPDMVDPMSPIRHPPMTSISLDIVVGGAETPAWVDQSRAFSKVCDRSGVTCTYHEIAGHHHYSIMTLMEKASDPLARLAVESAGGGR